MSYDVSPKLPATGDEERERPAKSRAWMWILLWFGLFLAVPSVLVGLLHQQKARQYAESLPLVSQQETPAAPGWVRLRGHYRVQESHSSAHSGNVVLLAPESMEDVIAYFEQVLHSMGFEVSQNLMRHEEQVATAILSASHAAEGRYALITMSRSAHGTRIELAWSQSK